MEQIQKDILTVLLRRVFERGLISESTYESAGDSLHAETEPPRSRQGGGAEWTYA